VWGSFSGGFTESPFTHIVIVRKCRLFFSFVFLLLRFCFFIFKFWEFVVFSMLLGFYGFIPSFQVFDVR
jgi:hypothetical protein